MVIRNLPILSYFDLDIHKTIAHKRHNHFDQNSLRNVSDDTYNFFLALLTFAMSCFKSNIHIIFTY